jgi:uncharacterized repeat protein (TIGR03833 family)
MLEIIKNLIEESKIQDYQNRNSIKPGMKVVIVTKQNQRTENYNIGIVKRLLTSKKVHTRGIKVELTDGNIGRVQCVFSKNSNCEKFIKK